MFEFINRIWSGQFNALVSQGDSARDRRDWRAAADFYGKALKLKPKVAGIWVQYGHARKEMGDLPGGEAAYRRALELQPEYADTALQIGHIVKLQGRRDEAVEWYKKSFIWSAEPNESVRELLGLGWDRAMIHRIVRKRGNVAFENKTPVGSRRLVVEVTAAWNQLRQHGYIDRESKWFVDLAKALSANSLPLMAIVDDKSGNLALLDKASSALLLESMASGIVVDPRLGPLPMSGNLAILAQPASGEDPEAVCLAVRDAVCGKDVPVVVIARGLSLLRQAAWSSQAEFAREKNAASQYIQQASGIIAQSGDDLAIITAVTDGQRRPARIEYAQIEPMSTRLARQTRSTGETIALASRDPAENRAMVAAWRAGPVADQLLTLVAVKSDPAVIEDLRVQFGDAAADGIEFVAPKPALVAERLRGARFFLVPRARTDGEIWVGDALEAGASVIASVDSDVYSRWGAAVSDYVSFLDASALARRWSDVALMDMSPPGDAPPNAAEAVADTWLRSYEAPLQRLYRDIAADGYDRSGYADVGVFYSLGSAPLRDLKEKVSDGRVFRTGSGWILPPEKGGSAIKPEGCRLSFRIDYDLDNLFRCSILVGNDTPDRVELTSSVESNGAHVARHHSLPESGWSWIHLDVKSRPGMPTLINVDLAPVREETDVIGKDCPVSVAGMIICPSKDESYWSNFLKSVSKGQIAAIRFIRNRAGGDTRVFM